MTKLFRKAGFNEIRTVVYYSPTKYFLVFVPAYVLMASFMQLCRAFGFRYFCSGFVISARRPD